MASRVERLRAWFSETHSAGFELRRHFFFRFFDSELISTPSQWKVVAGGAFAIVASLSIIFVQAYYHKYRLLNELESAEPFQMAMLADALFIVTLAMFLVGLFTTLQWPSLFPGLRDYLALAALPIRMRELFVARFTALLALAGGFIVATNLLPSVILPMVSNGDHNETSHTQIVPLFVACCLAAWFVFFALVAIQGILLNVLSIRQFPRMSLAVQGLLLALILCGLPLVFSIPNLHPFMKQRPEWILWFPPAWFVGMQQMMLGNHEPYATRLAAIGLGAVTVAMVTAISTYLWSYRRHKVRVLESPTVETAAPRFWPAAATDWILPNSRELAMFSFIAKMLARSRQHRLILTAFAALALAIIVESFVSLALAKSFRGFSVQTLALRQATISAPLALSLFVIAGFRYLFRLPVELRANWVFRMNTAGNRLVLLSGVERFLLYGAVMPVALLTLPLEVFLLGPAIGFAASAVCLITSLVLVEVLLIPFDQIPFTSSYMPGRRPLIEVVVRYGIAVAAYVTVLSVVIGWCVQTSGWTLVLSIVLLASWWKARQVRIEAQQIGSLEFEELMEPAIMTLGIERD